MCILIQYWSHSRVQLRRTTSNTTSNKRLITIDDLDRSALPFNTGKLKHSLNLASTLCTGELAASTYHNKWIVVDYMFYSADQSVQDTPKITLVANYQLPTIEECDRVGPIPNGYFGSDHYSIAARFAFT